MDSLLRDQIASGYYDTTAKRSHSASPEHYESWSKQFTPQLKPWLPANKNAHCLDVACGCGEFLYLLDRAGYANTSGVDLCQEELTQAGSYVHATLFHENVLDHLRSLPPESKDFISALNFLEHLNKEELMATLKECRRVLRPGGTLMAMVPNAISPFGSLTRYWDITHEWAFTPNNFHQLAALTGFDSQIDFRECGPIPHGLKSWTRYLLWRVMRWGISLWFLVEVGSVRSQVFTMDMLVRLHVKDS